MKNHLEFDVEYYLDSAITSFTAFLAGMLSPSWVNLKNEICHEACHYLIVGKLSNRVKTMLSPSWVTMLSKKPFQDYSCLSSGKLSNLVKNTPKKILVGKSENSLFTYIQDQKLCWEPDIPPYIMGVKKHHKFIWEVFVAAKNQKQIIKQICKKTFWSSG